LTPQERCRLLIEDRNRTLSCFTTDQVRDETTQLFPPSGERRNKESQAIELAGEVLPKRANADSFAEIDL
jgi:hypothetical protein